VKTDDAGTAEPGGTADESQRVVAPILVVYRPETQSTVLESPLVEGSSDEELRQCLYAPYIGSGANMVGTTHLTSFKWGRGRVIALTRLADIRDPLSGRSGLDVAIGAWVHAAATSEIDTPCQMIVSWLRAAAAETAGYGKEVDELDAIVLASVENDVDALKRVQAGLRYGCGRFRYLAEGPKRPRWQRVLAGRARPEVSGVLPYLLAGHPESLRCSALLSVLSLLVDTYLRDCRGRGHDFTISVLSSLCTLNTDWARVPSTGRYRRLPDGGIVFY
jgi:hypothetical protein